jgi:hypothetical protein
MYVIISYTNKIYKTIFNNYTMWEMLKAGMVEAEIPITEVQNAVAYFGNIPVIKKTYKSITGLPRKLFDTFADALDNSPISQVIGSPGTLQSNKRQKVNREGLWNFLKLASSVAAIEVTPYAFEAIASELTALGVGQKMIDSLFTGVDLLSGGNNIMSRLLVKAGIPATAENIAKTLQYMRLAKKVYDQQNTNMAVDTQTKDPTAVSTDTSVVQPAVEPTAGSGQHSAGYIPAHNQVRSTLHAKLEAEKTKVTQAVNDAVSFATDVFHSIGDTVVGYTGEGQVEVADVEML